MSKRKPKVLIQVTKNPSEVERDRKQLPTVASLRTKTAPVADRLTKFIGLGSWTIEGVIAARNSLAAGRFKLASLLFDSIKTDAACFTAMQNRVAPMASVPCEMMCGSADGHAAREGGQAEKVTAEATATFLTRNNKYVRPETLKEINLTLATFGYCVGQIVRTPREDGSRIDFTLEVWPLEFTQYFEIGMDGGRGVYALTREGQWVPIVHGDGQWVEFQSLDTKPWTMGALIALAGVWADRAFAIRDRAANATAHGDSKWIGTLPQQVPIESKEGDAMLEQMVALSTQFNQSVLKPFGSEIERSEAVGQNWQIFKEIIEADNEDAAKIYLGQDVSGTAGSSQRLSSAQLFNVRDDIVKDDLCFIERGLNTGFLRPWQIVNFGRDDLVVGWRWLIPDPDEDERRKSISARTRAFVGDVLAARQAGFLVSQSDVDGMAERQGVPTLQVSTNPLQPIALEPQVSPVQMPNVVQQKSA